jgi:hypothetical protein
MQTHQEKMSQLSLLFAVPLSENGDMNATATWVDPTGELISSHLDQVLAEVRPLLNQAQASYRRIEELNVRQTQKDGVYRWTTGWSVSNGARRDEVLVVMNEDEVGSVHLELLGRVINLGSSPDLLARYSGGNRWQVHQIDRVFMARLAATIALAFDVVGAAHHGGVPATPHPIAQ